MTSATGNPQVVRKPVSRWNQRRRGFTMIEILMVITILVLLSSLVVVAASAQRRKAFKRATDALLVRVEDALEEYRSHKGRYPPDGFDSEVVTDKGVAIHGSACLLYFLTRPMTVEKEISGEIRVETVEPLIEFKRVELYPEAIDDAGEIREIIDAWGTPIHYDNTENGRFEEQDGTAHLFEEEYHPPDPRSSVELKAVDKEGIQSKGYDLWSHGQGRHEEFEDLSSTIASWSREQRD
jgi:prepilin-type N-terminal cleavage/methylation domain-containing protein